MNFFQAEDLFFEIKEQFVDGLEEQTWMDNTTRDGVRDKVSKGRTYSYSEYLNRNTKCW